MKTKPKGAVRVPGQTGIYRIPQGFNLAQPWFVRVTITEGGHMLRDEGRELPSHLTLEEVIEKREEFRRELEDQLVNKPEFCEILDRDGQVIFGMKRDKVVKNRRIVRPPKRNLGLMSFLDEVKQDKDSTLRGMLDTAQADLEKPEDPEVRELIDVFERLIAEYDISLGYVRAAGAVVHADMGSDLLVRARQVLELFE